MKSEYGIAEGDHFRTMTIQETGGTRKTVEQGVARLREMMPAADAARRETISAGELVLALPMRRLRRLFGHHRQPLARRRRRHPGG